MTNMGLAAFTAMLVVLFRSMIAEPALIDIIFYLGCLFSLCFAWLEVVKTYRKATDEREVYKHERI